MKFESIDSFINFLESSTPSTFLITEKLASLYDSEIESNLDIEVITPLNDSANKYNSKYTIKLNKYSHKKSEQNVIENVGSVEISFSQKEAMKVFIKHIKMLCEKGIIS